jgi:hypothetical protein
VRQPLQRRISPGERHPGALTPHHLLTQLVDRIRLPAMSLAGHTCPSEPWHAKPDKHLGAASGIGGMRRLLIAPRTAV